MSDRSTIEWTEATWNPTTGCDQLSPGCDNCYALTLAKRLKAMGNPKYQEDGASRTSGPGFALTLHKDELALPHRWKSPRVIFVNSMSDLFHPEVPDEFIEDVFQVMADTPRHTYQVLTKRSQRLLKLSTRLSWPDNIWMGVSVETDRYCFRVDHLRKVPAAIRFVSAEPLLGELHSLGLDAIDWVIAGGESGANARPMHPSWAFDLRDRCIDTNTAFFFKQWGAWTPRDDDNAVLVVNDGTFVAKSDSTLIPGSPILMRRVSKSEAGRELEGKTWDQMPNVG
ncbi:DUF5131 family protein [Candidatus Poriferisocius sp.]|uniref:DUF5131 family protein n=1 Tax=Candidatus Poriferisocius sp. TaxID=3101276 RepID=UPI003B027124